MSCENTSKLSLLLADNHLSESDRWCLIWCTSSSLFGAGVWDKEIKSEIKNPRIKWRRSPVKRLLFDVMFSFTKENSFSHRYVLPDIESVWAAWMSSWGKGREWTVQTQSPPQNRILRSVCHYIGAQSVPFVCVRMDFQHRMQMGYWTAGICFFALQNRKIGVWSRLQVGWVFLRAMHGGTRL